MQRVPLLLLLLATGSFALFCSSTVAAPANDPPEVSTQGRAFALQQLTQTRYRRILWIIVCD